MKAITLAAILTSCLATEAIAQAPPGEVSGPLSANPFVMEPPSPTPPCGTVSAGCQCCRWAPASESGADFFNLYRMNDLRNLRTGGYQYECSTAGLVDNFAQCCVPGTPAIGQVAGFLVQAGRIGVPTLGILGRNSAGALIPAALPCP